MPGCTTSQDQSTKDVVVALARGQAKAKQEGQQQMAKMQAELAGTAAQLVALQQAHDELKERAQAEKVGCRRRCCCHCCCHAAATAAAPRCCPSLLPLAAAPRCCPSLLLPLLLPSPGLLLLLLRPPQEEASKERDALEELLAQQREGAQEHLQQQVGTGAQQWTARHASRSAVQLASLAAPDLAQLRLLLRCRWRGYSSSWRRKLSTRCSWLRGLLHTSSPWRGSSGTRWVGFWGCWPSARRAAAPVQLKVPAAPRRRATHHAADAQHGAPPPQERQQLLVQAATLQAEAAAAGARHDALAAEVGALRLKVQQCQELVALRAEELEQLQQRALRDSGEGRCCWPGIGRPRACHLTAPAALLSSAALLACSAGTRWPWRRGRGPARRAGGAQGPARRGAAGGAAAGAGAAPAAAGAGAAQGSGSSFGGCHGRGAAQRGGSRGGGRAASGWVARLAAANPGAPGTTTKAAPNASNPLFACAEELARVQEACRQQVQAAQADARAQLESVNAKLRQLRLRQRRLMGAVSSLLSEEEQEALSGMLLPEVY